MRNGGYSRGRISLSKVTYIYTYMRKSDRELNRKILRNAIMPSTLQHDKRVVKIITWIKFIPLKLSFDSDSSPERMENSRSITIDDWILENKDTVQKIGFIDRYLYISKKSERELNSNIQNGPRHCTIQFWYWNKLRILVRYRLGKHIERE